MAYRTRARLPILLLGLGLLGACGVSATAAPDDVGPALTGLAEEERDLDGGAEPSGPIDPALAGLVDVYVDLGLEPDDARCVAEGVGERYGEIEDVQDVADVMGDCGLDYSDLAAIGESIGASGPEEGFREGLAIGLEPLGMDEEQIECFADAYVDEHGMDLGPSQDPVALQRLFAECDINPMTLTPPG